MDSFFNRKRKLVILDDDPTGIQTVNGCLVLTSWKKDIIRHAFEAGHNWAGMPCVIFPGNIGNENALLEVFQRFQNK